MANQYVQFSPGAVITDLYYGELERITCTQAGSNYSLEVSIKRDDIPRLYSISESDIKLIEEELEKFSRNEYNDTRRKFERIKDELERKKSGKKSILSRLGLVR